MSEFDRAKRKYERKVVETPRKRLGSDALVRVVVETDEGIQNLSFRVGGFVGNTLAWQRSEKGLKDRFSQMLSSVFGGNVRVE